LQTSVNVEKALAAVIAGKSGACASRYSSSALLQRRLLANAAHCPAPPIHIAAATGFVLLHPRDQTVSPVKPRNTKKKSEPNPPPPEFANVPRSIHSSVEVTQEREIERYGNGMSIDADVLQRPIVQITNRAKCR